MTFHNVLFPPSISYGSVAGAEFGNVVLTTETGHSTRLRQKDLAIRRWEIRADNFPPDLAQTLWNFAHARHGSFYSFKFFDWTEMSTDPVARARIGPEPHASVTPIGSVVAGQSTYPLFKAYQTDPIQAAWYTRRILKPMEVVDAESLTSDAPPWIDLDEFGRLHWFYVPGTGPGGLDLIEPVAIDYEAGTVTFPPIPVAPGSPIYWAGYFTTPVRFGSDVDTFLARNINSFETFTFDPFSVVEDITAAEGERLLHSGYGGGAERITLAAGATHYLRIGDGAFQVITPMGAGVTIRLPLVDHWMLGGPVVTIANASPLYGLAIKTSTGATLTPLDLDNLPADNVVSLYLTQSFAGAYQWRYGAP